MPTGAMRSSILNVWMMPLKQARLVGVLRDDVEPGSEHITFNSVTLAELVKCLTT